MQFYNKNGGEKENKSQTSDPTMTSHFGNTVPLPMFFTTPKWNGGETKVMISKYNIIYK